MGAQASGLISRFRTTQLGGWRSGPRSSTRVDRSLGTDVPALTVARILGQRRREGEAGWFDEEVEGIAMTLVECRTRASRTSSRPGSGF